MSKNNEVMEQEVIENGVDVLETEVYEEPEESGVGLGKLALGVGLVAGGIGFLCYKFRGKFEDHQVKKLKNKGYIVIKPEDKEIEEVEDFEDDDYIDDLKEESVEKE